MNVPEKKQAENLLWELAFFLTLGMEKVVIPFLPWWASLIVAVVVFCATVGIGVGAIHRKFA